MQHPAPPSSVFLTGMGGVLGEGLAACWSEEVRSKMRVGGRRVPKAWEQTPFTSLDLSEEGSLFEVLSRFRPKVLLYAAAESRIAVCEEKPRESKRVNLTSLRDALPLLQEMGTRLVYISTDQVFDGTQLEIPESTIPSPLHAYGRQKAEAEAHVLEANQVVVRIPLLFGPTVKEGREGADAWVLRATKSQSPLKFFTDEFRAAASARSLAPALLQILCGKGTGVYHLAGGRALSRWEIAQEVCRYAALPWIHQQASLKEWQGAPRPARLFLTCQRAQGELGFHPPDLRQSLAKLTPPPDD